MPSEAMNKWFKSHRFALIENEQLRPVQHPIVKDAVLSIQQGQAEIFYLENKTHERKLLKVFYNHKRPDTSYLRTVSTILPRHTALRCGTERRILTSKSIQKSPDCYHSAGLAKWIHDSILMPQIQGQDWISVIEAIRNKHMVLDAHQRRQLCLNLACITKILESHGISHRDFSGGNIFIDLRTLDIFLIDLDSLYHPYLIMPRGTTLGSDGYTAPFILNETVNSSFCPLADRFAMTILCVEFLLINPSSPSFHEGGLFSQEELCQRHGKTFSYVESELARLHPQALALFQKVSKSHSFQECPSPDDWIAACKIPEYCLSVDTLPEVSLTLPRKQSVVALSLPEDPWKKRKGEMNYEFI